VHRIGPSPYLHYQPTWLNRPTRSLACTHAVLTARRHRSPATAPTAATCSRPPRTAHAAATPCATPIAGARALESCARQLHQPPPPLHAPHMQPPPVRLPSRYRSGGEAVHSSSHRYRRVLATPLELTIATFPGHRRLPPLVPLRPHDPTNSVDRARRCSPTSPTEPTTAD
jgi:hypothetical protein